MGLEILNDAQEGNCLDLFKRIFGKRTSMLDVLMLHLNVAPSTEIVKSVFDIKGTDKVLSYTRQQRDTIIKLASSLKRVHSIKFPCDTLQDAVKMLISFGDKKYLELLLENGAPKLYYVMIDKSNVNKYYPVNENFKVDTSMGRTKSELRRSVDPRIALLYPAVRIICTSKALLTSLISKVSDISEIEMPTRSSSLSKASVVLPEPPIK